MGAFWVNCQQCASFQLGTHLPQCRKSHLSSSFRAGVICAELNDTRLAVFAIGQQRAEIQVMGKNDIAIFARIGHDFSIRSI